eukprot:TRINITY_DN10729_c0_g1_i1.p1 TRINITY_DN10729_c0_g1~~TRINITY_DN10729_c0_g1_i1.p1  ORF type:complete len:372 (+),score=64.17 TRINITY_DN10729_c0_g1_i1:90-1205(+)
MISFRCLVVLALFAFGSCKKKYSVDFDRWELHKVEEDFATTETIYTYRSVPFIMRPGQIVQAPQHVTFPPGRYGVTSFWGKVVNEYGQQVPQSQVYVHHWAVTHQRKNAGYTPTQTFVYSVGSETRNALTMHAPYAYVPHPDDKWTGMVHILDTRFAKSVKDCIECVCPSERKDCCDDNTFCETVDYPKDSEAVYFLEYVIRTVEFDEDLVPVKPVILDVADGHVHYDVPACAEEPCVHVKLKQQVVPDELDIAVMVGHLHQGSLNMTTVAVAPDGSTKLQCINAPTIGTGRSDELGNETNYLVNMNVCRWNPPARVPAGSRYSITAFYNNEKPHYGVMGLCIFYVVDYAEWATVRAELAAAEDKAMRGSH